MNVLNIYFSGSIHGGRQKEKDYCELIEYLKNFGIVLDEHVGDLNLQKIDKTEYSDNFEENIYIKFTK